MRSSNDTAPMRGGSVSGFPGSHSKKGTMFILRPADGLQGAQIQRGPECVHQGVSGCDSHWDPYPGSGAWPSAAQCGWASSNRLKAELTQRQKTEEFTPFFFFFFFPACLLELAHVTSPSPASRLGRMPSLLLQTSHLLSTMPQALQSLWACGQQTMRLCSSVAV